MPGFSIKLPPLPGLLWIIALWALFYGGSDLFAQTPTAKPDTRVVIDISGSMKKTDPQNLRVPATKLLINLAKDDSRFGVWSFGQQVNNLVPVAPVSAEWKKSASRAADAIHSRGLFTHIGAALEAAAMGQTQPDPAWDRTIVLLSDGMVDISKDPAVNATEKARVLDTVVPKLRAAGFRIHAVALSEQADLEFLKTLALQTQGTYTLVRTADDLMKAFVATSDKVNLPEQVPLEGDQFSIDESVKEFTALIFRKPGAKDARLKAPDGEEYSLAKGSRNVSWFADQQYDLVTVYNPVPGRWRVLAELDPSSRVTVVSDLQLEMQGLPDNVLEGEKVTMTMFLAERGRAVANPQFLELMDITFSQETDKGEKFEGKLSHDSEGKPRVPEDGIYSAKLGRTLVEGEHTFSVLVDGKTFKRKKLHKMAVYRDVLDVRTDYRDENGQVIQFLVAEPRPGLADPEKLELIAQVQDPKGGKSIQTATLQADGRWKFEVPPLAGLGNYDLLIKVKGVASDNTPFERVQGPYSVDYTPLTGMPATSPQTAAVDTATPPVTFDASALDIPSLDVEELPPDDMPPLDEPEPVVAESVVPEPEDEAAPAPDIASADESTTGETGETSWLLLASLFILGNVAIVGVGVYFYIRFLRKTDAEQARVVDEIAALKQKQKAEKSAAGVASAAVAVAPELDMAVEEIPDEATVMRTGDTDANPVSAPAVAEEFTPPPVVAKAPPPPPAREDTYVNTAAPLELDDDGMVEMDEFEDEFEDELQEESASLDDLDMMLSEQEGTSDTELNQTIDAMLEQPTVFPDKKKVANDSAASRFADDEFMLDNPDNKT